MNENLQTNEKQDKALEIINRFTINLNEVYEQHKKQTKLKIGVIGREREIKEIIRVLSRWFQNNPLLIGHAGVGKTALVEGLVQWIQEGKVPQYLWDKKVYQLDMLALMSGTKFQGMLEERIRTIMNFMSQPQNNAILFIDEIHTIIGAGRTQGSLDMSNLLKPMLVKGNIQCIGATTYDEYVQYIEKETAFARRFSNITVNETSVEQTFQILKGTSAHFNVYYQLKITDEALNATLDFSLKYLTTGYLPNKAITLLDQTCAQVKSDMWYEPEIIKRVQESIYQLETEKKQQEETREKNKYRDAVKFEIQDQKALEEISIDVQENIQKIDWELNKLGIKNWKAEQNSSQLQQRIDWQKEILRRLIEQDQKEKSIIQEITKTQADIEQAQKDLSHYQKEQNYTDASRLKFEVIPYLNTKLEQLENMTTNNIFRRYFVGREQVASIVAEKCGLALGKIMINEQKKLLTLFPTLQQKIKGQGRALRLITNAIVRARAEVQEFNKPLASFLFVGPTGTGKTESALTIAEQLYDSRDRVLRLNMTEFSEPHSVSKLIGSPPGYIGYEQNSYFEKLREKISNVVIFDEVEKAHHEVVHLLLQILDTGFLRLSNGKLVDFRHSIVVLTSNLGSELYFEELTNEQLEEELTRKLKEHFRPEFISRIGDVVFFNALNKTVFREIVTKELQLFVNRIQREKRIKLRYDETLVDFVFEENHSLEDGARAIKRCIERKIGNAIAYGIVFQSIKPGISYLLEVEKETKQIKVSSLLNLQ